MTKNSKTFKDSKKFYDAFIEGFRNPPPKIPKIEIDPTLEAFFIKHHQSDSLLIIYHRVWKELIALDEKILEFEHKRVAGLVITNSRYFDKKHIDLNIYLLLEVMPLPPARYYEGSDKLTYVQGYVTQNDFDKYILWLTSYREKLLIYNEETYGWQEEPAENHHPSEYSKKLYDSFILGQSLIDEGMKDFFITLHRSNSLIIFYKNVWQVLVKADADIDKYEHKRAGGLICTDRKYINEIVFSSNFFLDISTERYPPNDRFEKVGELTYVTGCEQMDEFDQLLFKLSSKKDAVLIYSVDMFIDVMISSVRRNHDLDIPFFALRNGIVVMSLTDFVYLANEIKLVFKMKNASLEQGGHLNCVMIEGLEE